MSVVAFIQRCIDAGMDWETALLAAEQFEATLAEIKTGRYAGDRPVRVYVIAEEGGHVKVGVSDAPAGRMFALQTSNPRLLRLAYQSRGFPRAEAMSIEREAHRELKDRQTSGEWFACSPDEAIDAVWKAGGCTE